MASAILVACLAAPPAGCADPATESASRPDPVRAVVLPYLGIMPLHIAARDGYFAEQGVDVEFVKLGRNQEIMASLARGQVDVAAGMITANELALAAMGSRVRIVGGLAELVPGGCTYAGILVRREHLKGRALENPDRIRGLRFDVPLLTPLEYWVDRAVRAHGLSIDDLDIVDLPSPAALEAMRRGRIDVTVDSQPWIGRHLRAGEAAVWRAVGAMLPHYPHSVVMYGPSLIDDRPEVGERFLTAVLGAARQWRRGKTARNLEIVEEVTGLSRKQAESTCWPMVPDDLSIDTDRVRDYQEWAVDRGILERVVPDTELFDFRFARHASDALE